jgi:riboflavin-specific deaminase-like protein
MPAVPPSLLTLFPEADATTPARLISGLSLGGRAPEERPYVVLNMVASLDGKAVLEGRTRGLSSDTDRELFHQLRTQADAVMVGAGTLRAERYGRMVRRPELREKRAREGLAPDPLAVVVSGSLALPPDLPLLQDRDSRVLIATGSDAELGDVGATVEYERTGDDLRLLLARLRADHGVRSVLCEGGPTLNFHLLSGGLVDELFLAISSQLVGGVAALTIVGGGTLVEPASAELLWLGVAEGDLFTRWRL